MNFENIVAAGIGVSCALAYVEVLRPLYRISKQSGIPITQIDVSRALSLDVKLQEWCSMIPTRDTVSVLEYVSDTAGIPAAEKIHPILISHDAPFPSYWDKMYLRSLALREKVAKVYAQPEIANYLRA